MKIVTIFNEELKPYKNGVLQFLNDFHLSGETIYSGTRNILKQKAVKDKKFVIKYFKKPHFINQLAYKYFRESKAKRSYLYAQKLLSLGIGTPKPVAYRNKFTWFGLEKSYYVSEYQTHDLTFRELPAMEDINKRNQILFEFVKFTHLMHENGVHFLDHSPGNTLIEERDGKFYFYLVDLNRMKFESLTRQQCIQNFARLTQDVEIIKVMSLAYAELIHEDKKIIHQRFSNAVQDFFEAKRKKRALKNKIKFWKKIH